MIGYSDTNFTAPLYPAEGAPEHRIAEKRALLQLAPLWEHVVRTRNIPEDVSLDDVFVAIHERLRDPEWEVRQHALRVLVDVIPVVDDGLDHRMELLLGDVVGSLGHPGPAVRKGALDSLKVYLKHSYSADDILRNMVYRGVEHYSDNQLHSDVVMGIILSLPALIFPETTSKSNVSYVVRSLVSKLIQVTFQEVSLRSLVRIREAIGANDFDSILSGIQPDTKDNFDLLCQVYDANGQRMGFGNHDGSPSPDRWNDHNANAIDARWNSDSDSAGAHDERTNGNAPSGKVILETEIQFDKDTAFTMTILEEGDAKSLDAYDSDEDNRDCVMKILSDSENDEFDRRRTPRRVRFGGEIVKMRTPDSDSNQPSDTDEITIANVSARDVIEIKFIADKKHQSRSMIPVPVGLASRPKARSLPTSPNRPEAKQKMLYQSHPNLTRNHFFNRGKTKAKQKYVDISTSPIPMHNEIELFHNLTRSPQRTNETIQNESINRKISTADSVLLDSNRVTKSERNVSTADVTNTIPHHKHSEIPKRIRNETLKKLDNSFDTSDNDSMGRSFNSFVLKDSGSDGIMSDSFIPTNDTGDCLTCSSSGSEGIQHESNWEISGIVDKRTVENMLNKDDWRLRLRGLGSFLDALRAADAPKRLSPHLSSFLHFIFGAERHPRLQRTAEDIIKCVLSTCEAEALELHASQLASGISKMGAPVGIRLAIVLMQQLSAKTLVGHLMDDSIMSSRSAKTKEGALQILLCATRMFPSTEFDTAAISRRVALVATDRKRRIRQASLDVLAVLAQLGLPGEVLEAVAAAVKDLPEKDTLQAAVRARLSRRQLPIVEDTGNVMYASPGVGRGADVDWVAAGSGSVSPCSARSRRVVMIQPNEPGRATSAVLQRNLWSGRRFQEPDSLDSHFERKHANWSMFPVENREEPNGRIFSTAPFWTFDQNRGNRENRFSTSHSSIRPVYLLQNGHSKKPSEDTSDTRRARGRSSSPPVRLVQIRGVAQHRGQSSSPDYQRSDKNKMKLEPIHQNEAKGNWSRDFHSSIPVPVGMDGRSRIRSFNKSSQIGSAPIQVYGRTKSPSPTHSNGLNSTQDTIETQRTSSESSDYYTPPAEPYVAPQPDVIPLQQIASESFDNSEMSNSPQPERFITLSTSASDLEEQNKETYLEESEIRNQVYQKLQEDYVDGTDEAAYRERVSAGILSKSHADLTTLKTNKRKTINSAPPVKSFDDIDNISLHNDESNVEPQTEILEDSNKNVMDVQNKNFVEETTVVKCPEIVKKTPKSTPKKPELRRKVSNKVPALYPDTLRPFPKPREGMSEMIMQLENPEWETTMKGLQSLVRLVRHHQETVESQIHNVCVLLGRHIKNLRSQVARAACVAAAEMFITHKKALEMEIEEIAAPLLHRTADTNKFLRSDAIGALDAMCLNLGTSRVVAVLCARGASHHNAVVRCATARLFGNLIERLGVQRVFALPKDTRDKVLGTAASMLMEGSLETRKHAKLMLTQLSSHPNFQRAIHEAVPQTTLRHISKILNNLK